MWYQERHSSGIDLYPEDGTLYEGGCVFPTASGRPRSWRRSLTRSNWKYAVMGSGVITIMSSRYIQALMPRLSRARVIKFAMAGNVATRDGIQRALPYLNM